MKIEDLNIKGYEVDPEVKINLATLFSKLEIIQALFNDPLIITGGLRSKEDVRRIYANKEECAVPWSSPFLIGAAADIADRDLRLAAFMYSHVQLLEDIGLWVEDPTYTRGRVTVQIYPSKSGARFFKPV